MTKYEQEPLTPEALRQWRQLDVPFEQIAQIIDSLVRCCRWAGQGYSTLQEGVFPERRTVLQFAERRITFIVPTGSALPNLRKTHPKSTGIYLDLRFRRPFPTSQAIVEARFSATKGHDYLLEKYFPFCHELDLMQAFLTAYDLLTYTRTKIFIQEFARPLQKWMPVRGRTTTILGQIL